MISGKQTFRRTATLDHINILLHADLHRRSILEELLRHSNEKLDSLVFKIVFIYKQKSRKGIFVYKDLRRCPKHNTSFQWFVPCCIASYSGAALRPLSIVCAPTNVAVEFKCFFGLASEISLFQITFGVCRHLIARD